MRTLRSSVGLMATLCVIAALVMPLPALAAEGTPPAAASAGQSPSRIQQDLATLQQYWQKATDGYAALAGSDLIGPGQSELLAKAPPDECFNGIGTPSTAGPTCDQGQPKVNQAYVWGLAKSGQTLWFGTAPNVLCLVLGGYLGQTTPMQTPSFVCEFGQSKYAQPPYSLPASVGDWRPSRIYSYNLDTKVLVDRTVPDPRLTMTMGLRSAMAIGKVTILAGPGLKSGVNLFAFNTETGAYLGSANLPQYSNIRKWVQVGGAYYTGVRNSTGGGSVLRWKGNGDTLQNLFDFEVVGTLQSEAAELAEHQGRLFVTTWPETTVKPVRQASLYMSPVMPAGGLTAADAANWTQVWQASDYEPDPVTAATYGGGALASFGGYLYWGTMHVPFMSALAHLQVYGQPADETEAIVAILGSNRAITIFRGQNFGQANQKIELAYGMANLPSYTPGTGWEIVPNKMGAAPLFGLSGFGNFYNNYTWTMAVYRDQLFVGTMDWSYLLADTLPYIVEYLTGQPFTVTIPFPLGTYGADLWRFAGPQRQAVPVSLFGVGNQANYGIRNMLAADALYLGMANPMNLLTAEGGPKGGWELLKVQAGR
jgi:hypothetical protein